MPSLTAERAAASDAWVDFLSSVHAGSNHHHHQQSSQATYQQPLPPSQEVYTAFLAAQDIFSSVPKALTTHRAKQRAWAWLKGGPQHDDAHGGEDAHSAQRDSRKQQQDAIPREHVSVPRNSSTTAGASPGQKSSSARDGGDLAGSRVPNSNYIPALDDALKQYREDVASSNQQPSDRHHHRHQDEKQRQTATSSSQNQKGEYDDEGYQGYYDDDAVETPAPEGFTVKGRSGNYDVERHTLRGPAARSPHKNRGDSAAGAGGHAGDAGEYSADDPDYGDDPVEYRLKRMSEMDPETFRRRQMEQYQLGQATSHLVEVPPFLGLAEKLKNRGSMQHPVDHSEVERRRTEERQISRVINAIRGAQDAVPETLSPTQQEDFSSQLSDLKLRASRCEQSLHLLNEEVDEQRSTEAALHIELVVYKQMAAQLQQVVRNHETAPTSSSEDAGRIDAIKALLSGLASR